MTRITSGSSTPPPARPSRKVCPHAHDSPLDRRRSGHPTLALSACGSSDPGPTPRAAAAAVPRPPRGKVGVILPDATTSPRWEANDRPLLTAAFKAAGVKADIQNADGDKAKFGTICDGMINAGVNVLLITNLDSESGSACLKKAQGAGIKTIDYDRLTLGGGASYYVSFDNVAGRQPHGRGPAEVPDRRGQDHRRQRRLHQRRPDRQQRRAVQAGLRRGAQAGHRRRRTTSSSATRPASGTPPRPAPRSSSCTRRTAARSTASSPPTTRWPAASSPASRPTSSTARSR